MNRDLSPRQGKAGQKSYKAAEGTAGAPEFSGRWRLRENVRGFAQ